MKRYAKVQVYEDVAGEWRWRLVASNGKIVADGGEGYTRRRDCLRAIDTVRHIIGDCWYPTRRAGWAKCFR